MNPMTLWERFTTDYGVTRYYHRARPDYSLRHVWHFTGVRFRRVWALHHGERRMHEIYAMDNLYCVRGDAEDWIAKAVEGGVPVCVKSRFGPRMNSNAA